MVAIRKTESKHFYSCPPQGKTIPQVLFITPYADKNHSSPSQLFCKKLFPLAEKGAGNYVINSAYVLQNRMLCKLVLFIHNQRMEQFKSRNFEVSQYLRGF